MNPVNSRICSWLEESDLEESGAQYLNESISESDRETEHFDFNSDTEQSANDSDNEIDYNIATPSQSSSSSLRQPESLRRSRSRSPISSTPRTRRRRVSSSSSSSSRSSSNEPLARLQDRRRRLGANTSENPSISRPARVPMYTGKDGTKWLANAPSRPNMRTRAENIITDLPGVRGNLALNAKTPLDCFRLFITQDMMNDIVSFTNIYIRANKDKFSRERDCKETDITEIDALTGLLVLAGLKKMNHVNIQEMWTNDGTSPDIFRATMSQTRFYFLLRNLRFDDKNTRTERARIDNMAATREIFESFVTNCKTHYQVGENVTIDEMLESFRGRCKFRVYMSSKPAKYGIKINAAVDSKTFYTSNLEVYAGRQPEGPYAVDNSPTALVMRLANTFLDTGRNITMDNYFTSVPLTNLLLNNHRTTVVGTMRKNKREIPPNFLDTKDRAKPSSLFGFNEKKVLVSYVPNKKKKKIVLLMSTLHDTPTIDESTGADEKPEIITYYNGTKGGVDVVDQMKEEYSVGRMTRRWPMRLFYTMINIAGINSQIIYKANTDQLLLRRTYLKEIALGLTRPYMIQRSAIMTLPTSLKTQIARFVPPENQIMPERREGKCFECPSKKNRRTKKGCQVCAKLLCNEHCTYLCKFCFDQAYEGDVES